MKNFPHQNLRLPHGGNGAMQQPWTVSRIADRQALAFLRLACYCAIIIGMLTGCDPKTPTITIGPPTKQPAAPKMPYFGKGATILATEYNAIAMRPGDTVTLSFPCAATLPDVMPAGIGMQMQGAQHDQVKIWLQKDPKTAAKGSGLTPNSPANNTPATITVHFNSPPFTFMIYNDPSRPFWPGDANADGYRNLLDLYAIAQAIKDAVVFQSPATTGTASTCSTAAPLSYPPNENGDMEFTYPACAWGTTFEWLGQTIDFMHADCNLDGLINESDADYLRAVMDPMYLPEFLKSGIDGATLTATYAPDTNGIQIPLGSNDSFAVRLPFEIAFASNAATPFVLPADFLGVTFSRPVAESAQYHLLDTRLDFSNSEIFLENTETTQNTVWRQKFWPDFNVEYADGVCAEASDRVLDVGAFRIGDPPSVTTSPLRIGRCQVTLDDILCPMGGGSPLISFLLTQHIVNGILFTKTNEGVVVPQSIECTTDETTVDLTTLCDVHDILLRDGEGDDATFASTPEALAWSSPSIWVRHAGGTANSIEHQQPINGQLEDVYVRVFNRSCKASKPGTVDVYWTYANTHEKWSNFSKINAIPLNVPSIPPFGNVVVRMPWKPLFEESAEPTSCGTMVSLLAVLNSSYDPITLPAATDDIHDWVLSNNNVAVRSTMAITTGKTETCAMISLHDAPNAVLMIEQIGDPHQLPASHYGNLIVQLNGYNGTLFAEQMTAVAGTQQYRLNTDQKSGYLNLFTLSGNETVQISFERSPGTILPELTSAQKYAFRVYVELIGFAQNSSIVEFTVH